MAKFENKPNDNRFIDLTGLRFGRLTVLGFHRKKSGRSAHLCLCDCGTEIIVPGASLRSGNTKSCGCQRSEVTTLRNKNASTHGMSKTVIFKSWVSMITRCENPHTPAYRLYGGRGITVCSRWRESFENFYADMGKRPPAHQLDRIDNNGPYSPDNCRWATLKMQANNRRTNHRITYNGKTQNIGEWAKELGLKKSTLSKRFKSGYSIKESLVSTHLSRGPRSLRAG